MTESTEIEHEPQPSSTADEGNRPERRWRDDPLSVFLAIAAVLLGGMYLLEQRDMQVLEDASARAKELGATTLDLPGCTVGSAGADGRKLVITCDDLVAGAVDNATALRPDLTGFDAVVIVGRDAQALCPANPKSWPNGCSHRPLPAPGSR